MEKALCDLSQVYLNNEIQVLYLWNLTKIRIFADRQVLTGPNYKF